MAFAKGLNLTLILLICGIFTFGFLTIFVQNPKLATQQLIFFGLGILFFLAISSLDIRIFKDFTIVFWFISLVLVFFVTLAAPEIRGSSRWVDLGFFRLQPTELAKPIVVLTLASFLEKADRNSAKTLLKAAGLVFPFVLAAFWQPDLGNAIIFILIWYLALFVSGYNLKILGSLGLLFLILLPVWLLILAPYQRNRIETFLNPRTDPLGAGYSVIQSQIAVGSGQIFGRSLSGATQSKLEFLPEAPTDFIFASIAESYGFVGALIFICLFSILIYNLITRALAFDRFSQILFLLTAGLLSFQFLINLAMSVGLLPVVGVTLPLVSYGGSSLISSFILLSFVQSRLRFAPRTS